MTLLALVLFVVLITGVNIANLMLSRTVDRSRELAVRVALGANRRRLLRQTVAESALLGAAGTVTGLLISMWLIRLLPALMVQPPGFPSFVLFGADARMLTFTIAVAVAISMLAGLAPAWTIARGEVGALIMTGPAVSGPARRRGRLAGALIVGQVAVSIALLSSAAVLALSFFETRRADLGFSRKPLLTAWAGTGPLAVPTLQSAVERLAALPGVKAVAVAIRAPLSLSGGGNARRIQIPGTAVSPADEAPEVKFGAVSTNYFETMGIRIVEGRAFTDDDQRPGEPVVIVNEQFAARFLAAGERVGRLVRIGKTDHRVVGIARNTVINRIDEPPEPYFYLPYWRGTHGELTFLVETHGDPALAGPAVRDSLKQIDARLEPRFLVTMEQYVRFAAADYQATAALAAALGTIGLLLTALGVYGVIAYRTTRRTREIGIRVALGATRAEIIGLVLREGARMTVRGLLIGLPAALVTTHLIRSLLFGVGPWDLMPLAGAATVLAGTVTVATLIPAWRATRVSPSTALRESP